MTPHLLQSMTVSARVKVTIFTEVFPKV